jgi:uncharacterized membrane protein
MKANVYDEARGPNMPQLDELGKPTTKAPAKAVWTEWLVLAALLLLSAIPIAGGAFRLTQLSGGTDITPENARFFASPPPVVLHIVSVTFYSLLGAFQFVPGFRRHRRAWHRTAGWILIPFGLVVALSGLWMTLFYPWPVGDGVILYGLRLFFGSLMLLSILFGVAAIRRRDFVQHGNWMMRGYALGLGAGTQAFTLMAWEVFFGKPDVLPRAMLMGAGWVINLALVEWIIRRRPAARVRTASAIVSPVQ